MKRTSEPGELRPRPARRSGRAGERPGAPGTIFAAGLDVTDPAAGRPIKNCIRSRIASSPRTSRVRRSTRATRWRRIVRRTSWRA